MYMYYIGNTNNINLWIIDLIGNKTGYHINCIDTVPGLNIYILVFYIYHKQLE